MVEICNHKEITSKERNKFLLNLLRENVLPLNVLLYLQKQKLINFAKFIQVLPLDTLLILIENKQIEQQAASPRILSLINTTTIAAEEVEKLNSMGFIEKFRGQFHEDSPAVNLKRNVKIKQQLEFYKKGVLLDKDLNFAGQELDKEDVECLFKINIFARRSKSLPIRTDIIKQIRQKIIAFEELLKLLADSTIENESLVIKGYELNEKDFANIALFKKLENKGIKFEFLDCKFHYFDPGLFNDKKGLCFSGCDFSKADLRKSNFTSCFFDKSSFSSSNLQGATFKFSEFTDVDFSNADLTKVDFTGAVFITTIFAGAKINDIELNEEDKKLLLKIKTAQETPSPSVTTEKEITENKLEEKIEVEKKGDDKSEDDKNEVIIVEKKQENEVEYFSLLKQLEEKQSEKNKKIDANIGEINDNSLNKSRLNKFIEWIEKCGKNDNYVYMLNIKNCNYVVNYRDYGQDKNQPWIYIKENENKEEKSKGQYKIIVTVNFDDKLYRNKKRAHKVMRHFLIKFDHFSRDNTIYGGKFSAHLSFAIEPRRKYCFFTQTNGFLNFILYLTDTAKPKDVVDFCQKLKSALQLDCDATLSEQLTLGDCVFIDNGFHIKSDASEENKDNEFYQKIMKHAYDKESSWLGEIFVHAQEKALLECNKNSVNKQIFSPNGYSYRLMLNDKDLPEEKKIGFRVENDKVTMKIKGEKDVSLSYKKGTEVIKICKMIIEANKREDKTFAPQEIKDLSQDTLISSYIHPNIYENEYKKIMQKQLESSIKSFNVFRKGMGLLVEPDSMIPRIVNNKKGWGEDGWAARTLIPLSIEVIKDFFPDNKLNSAPKI